MKRSKLPACAPRSGAAFQRAWNTYIKTRRKLAHAKARHPRLEAHRARLERLLVTCYGMAQDDLQNALR